MTKHDFKQHAYYMIYLIRCVLHDQIPQKEKLDKIDLSKLYEVAEKHSLTAITAYALESAGVVDERFTQAKAKAIRKNALFDIERQRIINEFEKAGIWYMPLKGVILQEFYPRYGMRQMCDNDILFDSNMASEVESIMISLGFIKQKTHTGHDVVFHKKPVCNFEMHYSLFSDSNTNSYSSYYTNVKTRLTKSENNDFEYRFLPSDCYIYLNVHEFKHFSVSGTGLRSLVDTYVFLNNNEEIKKNRLYINYELKKLGIYNFEKNKHELVLKLFNGVPLSYSEKELLDYYVLSGTYGKIENKIDNTTNKTVLSKIKYIKNRLFLNREQIKNAYPFYYKYKLLIPFLFFYRLGLMMTKSRKKVKKELMVLLKR